MSVAKPKTTTSQASTVNTTNLNVQDTEGLTVVGDSNAITTTDFGAIERAGEVSRAALDLGRDSLHIGADLAGRGLDNAFAFGSDTVAGAFNFGRDVASDGFSFGTRSLDTVADFADSSLSVNAGLARDSLDFARDVGGGVLDFAKGLVGDTVSGLQSLSMQTSSTSDDRVAKIATYAFIAVAALVVLPKLFSKG